MPQDVDIDIEDVEDALLRADELATITGRKKTDIVADLLDDGKLNLSAGADAEIKKDILDIAQEKAEKFKTLLTTLIPVFALLLGIGAEGLGVLDITGWGEESIFSPNGEDYGACLDSDAENYDRYASWDDGTCDFGVQIFPPCDNWNYEDYSTQDDNVLFLKYTFFSETDCGTELKGHFNIVLLRNDSAYRDANLNVQFTDEIEIEYIFDNLSEGNYYWELDFHTIECDDGTCEHGDEYILDQKPIFHVEAEVILGCIDESANNYNESATQDDGSCEYPPPPRCDIELYDILMTYNNTSARVQYDLDCGYDEVEGFNVSIQFWTTCANETNTTNYTIGFHYIQGDTADIHELFLRNLTAKTYDFHWIAVWEDEEGELFNLTEQWSDIEITG